MKKVLGCAVYSLLPDDFEGGFSKALRCLADYHDEVKNTPKQECGSYSSKSSKTGTSVNFGKFEKAVENGFRMSGEIGVASWNDEKKDWDSLDVNG